MEILALVKAANIIAVNKKVITNSGNYYSIKEKRDRQVDLLTTAGEKLIVSQTAIEKTPLGRWPSENHRMMSMMQQFATNTLEEKLESSGLFSVNGPPGTGKTTMLRDIIANNIVKRARVLAGLEKSTDAFLAEMTATNSKSQVMRIKQLIPQLTGCEMVVASSNNTAVENITKELPQKKSLGKSYDAIGYFKPVAQKLAAQHEPVNRGKTQLHPLNEDQQVWGLVAAVLGKSENRDTFLQRTVFKKSGNLEIYISCQGQTIT